MVDVVVGPDTPLILSRDVRLRRRDTDWFLHYRADAPVNTGVALSDAAMEFLLPFSAGAPPGEACWKDAARRRAVRLFVDMGVLLPTTLRVLGQEEALALQEVLHLREAIPIESLGLLELECLLLYVLARRASKGGTICELGSMFGGSTIALALGARAGGPDARVVAVDDHEWHRHVAQTETIAELREQIPSTLGVFRDNLARAEVADRVDLVVADTAAASAQASEVAMLFVDADHSLVGVTRDLKAWVPKVLPGGVIALHDYGNPLWPGVRPALDRFRDSLSALTVYQTLAMALRL